MQNHVHHKTHKADHQHTHKHKRGLGRVASLLDHVAETFGGCQQLRRHQCHPSGAHGHPQPGKDHGQSGGNGDLEQLLGIGCAEDIANPQVLLPGLPDAGVAVDDARHCGAEEDNRGLRHNADTEQEDEHGNPGQTGNRTNQVKQGAHKPVNPFVPGHHDAHRHAEDNAQGVTQKRNLQAGSQMNQQRCAVRRLCIQLLNEGFCHGNRPGENRFRLQMQNIDADIPCHQHSHDGGEGN